MANGPGQSLPEPELHELKGVGKDEGQVPWLPSLTAGVEGGPGVRIGSSQALRVSRPAGLSTSA